MRKLFVYARFNSSTPSVNVFSLGGKKDYPKSKQVKLRLYVNVEHSGKAKT